VAEDEAGTRRAHRRVDWRVPVRLVLPDRTILAATRNVSVGGLLIDTMAAIALGTTIRLIFRLPALPADTETDAVVRWTQPHAIGVQFIALRALEVRALNQLLR